MLEALFAREAQCRAFVQLCLCGVAAGAWLHASCGVYRRSRWLGAVWDAIGAAALGAGWLLTMLHSGDGVRAYGVLGILLGVLLYWLGVKPVVRMICKSCCIFSHRKAGNAGTDAEMIEKHK